MRRAKFLVKDYIGKHPSIVFGGMAVVVLILILSIALIRKSAHRPKETGEEVGVQATEVLAEPDTHSEEVSEVKKNEPVKVGDKLFAVGYSAKETPSTIATEEGLITGSYSILVNAETGEIVAGSNMNERMIPASMTKILTVLVAAEHIDMGRLDEKVAVPEEATDYSYLNDCSTAGFFTAEQISVRDLFYGTILPSGGDAAITLAQYTAGSVDAFVGLMNQKVEELGLSETSHFTNPVGIHDENLYTTAHDMAMILKAAVENEFCREILSEHVHKMEPDEYHPEGWVWSNLFLRRIEDHIQTGTVVSAKTGFVEEAGSCAASYEISATGVPYICVVAHSASSWACIKDHVAIYDRYAK